MKRNVYIHHSSDVSMLRRRIRAIHEEQLALLNIMMDCGPMIAGSIYQSYRTCSYPNCRCRQGQRHGPYATISYAIGGKHYSRPIRRDELPRGKYLVDRFCKAVGTGVMKLLIVDRGYVDGAFISDVKQRLKSDVMVPLKVNMDVLRDAIRLAESGLAVHDGWKPM